MSDGKRKPTDVEIFSPKPKPDRKLYHVTAPLLQTSLVQVVAYAFSWFTKFHGFMILTGTMKIGIQQIKLSIHIIRENLRKLHLFHITVLNL
jgi:hypothetical protein